MKFPGRVSTASFIFAIYACAAMAQDGESAGETRRICSEQDLSGTYALVNLSETPSDAEADWYARFPYQYLAFYPQSRYASIMMNTQVESAQKLTQLLAPPAGRANERTYTLSIDGVLNLYINNKISYSYRCVTSIAAGNGYQKGDLILTGYPIVNNRSNIIEYGKSEFYKLYRRWY